MFSGEKSSPLTLSGSMGGTSLGKSKGGAVNNYQKEVKDTIVQMDSLILKIMIDIEKNTIEYYEKMTHFFQESNEEDGRHSFREELLKFVQTEYRFQEMSIIDMENRDFVESIRVCYHNMQDIIRKGLKTTQSEIDYLNLFTKILYIKENLIKIYQDLGNYTYPLNSGEILKQLTKFIKFLSEQKFFYNSEWPGLFVYYNFTLLELKALLNLTYTLSEQENFYVLYYEEKMLFQLQKLRQSINEWIQLFKNYDCDCSKFKQIIFLQNFHLLLKCKLDFYSRDNQKFRFQQPFIQIVQEYNGLNVFSHNGILNTSNLNNSNLTHFNIQNQFNNSMNQFNQQQNQQSQYGQQNQFSQFNSQNQFSGLNQFPQHRQNMQQQSSSYPSVNKINQTKLDQYLGDRHIFEKLINKLHELYPQTCILILQKVTSEKYKLKMESKKQEDQLMQRDKQEGKPLKEEGKPLKEEVKILKEEMYEDYRITYKKCSLKESEFKDHMKIIMEYFTIQIGLIDNYIECSKYLMNSYQQFLFYKLDEQYYLLLEVYKMDKKLINNIVDYISQLCELLRNKNCIVVSKEKSKPFKSFVDFVKDKLEGAGSGQGNSNIGSSSTLSSKGNR